MANGIAGRLLRARLDGDYFKCQMDLTVSLAANTSTDDPCKPEGATIEDSAPWDEPQIDSWGGTVTLNIRNFLEQSAPFINQSDILTYILDGHTTMDLDVLTTPGQHTNSEDVILSMSILITGYDWNAPAVGRANSDVTFTIVGKPTYERIPVSS